MEIAFFLSSGFLPGVGVAIPHQCVGVLGLHKGAVPPIWCVAVNCLAVCSVKLLHSFCYCVSRWTEKKIWYSTWKIFADETKSVYDFKDKYRFGLKGGKTCGQNTVLHSNTFFVPYCIQIQTKVFNYGTSYDTPLHGPPIQLTSLTWSSINLQAA